MKLQHECIEDALGALAEDRPAAPALQAPGRKPLTYADLAAQIHRVRKCLGGLDIGRGDIVAGVIPSRPEMAVACATLPASSTFAPLSPSLTPDDYSQLVVRMGAKAILAPKGEEHPVRAAARRHGVAEIDVAVEPDAPAGLFTLDLGRAGDSLRNPTPARPQLAYVLVSSGTTGRPKLIPSQHRQTLRYASVVGKRSEEHTSELQSPDHLVCRLLLEKKKNPHRRLTPLPLSASRLVMHRSRRHSGGAHSATVTASLSASHPRSSTSAASRPFPFR